MRAAALLLVLCGAAAPLRAQHADHVIVVTLDGMRWQEIFGGAARGQVSGADGGVGDTTALLARFWRDTPDERRRTLMPFLWGVIARDGQIFGDSTLDAPTMVTNGLWFSYPGYNELLAGAGDPRIDSNDKVPNPNVTVLEWLNGRACCRGRVAAFGSWDVLPFIVNGVRSGILVNGDGPPFPSARTAREREMNDHAADLPDVFGLAVRLDAPTMWAALEYLRTTRPRVLYVMLGETDEWAHARRYDLYLDAAWRGDRFIRMLWEAAQATRGMRGRTALLVATDHGRGAGPRDWTDHGRRVPAARRIWMAAMGPGVQALGLRAGVETTQSQLAATVAALLGEDYAAAARGAAPPLPLR